MHTLETFDVDGVTVKICPDEDTDQPCPIDPEEGGDNKDGASVWFVTWERNSYLTDYHDFAEPQDALDYAKENGYEVFPLFRYEHGLVCYRCSAGENPFHCEWDSGRSGFVLVKTAHYEGVNDQDGQPMTTKRIADGICEAVTTWVNGSYYGYIIEDDDGNDLDSCWGIDDLDYCRKEATDTAKYCAKQEAERKARAQYADDLSEAYSFGLADLIPKDHPAHPA